MATKKQVEKWIEELGVEWTAHGVTKAELIDAAHAAEDPHQYLEELAEAQSDDEEEDEFQQDEGDEIQENHEDENPGEGIPPEDPAAAEGAEEYARQGIGHRPKCPRHNVLMTAGSTQGPLTYYYCPEDGCSHSEKVPRVNMDKFLKRQGQDILGAPQVNPRE